MTRENRWLFSLKDIVAIRFNCKKCGAVVSFPPDNIKEVPYTCGNCGKEWLQTNSAEERDIHVFTNAVEALRKMDNDRFAMQFELPGE